MKDGTSSQYSRRKKVKKNTLKSPRNRIAAFYACMHTSRLLTSYTRSLLFLIVYSVIKRLVYFFFFPFTLIHSLDLIYSIPFTHIPVPIARFNQSLARVHLIKYLLLILLAHCNNKIQFILLNFFNIKKL